MIDLSAVQGGKISDWRNRLAEVRARIVEAAGRVGRDPSEIEILPVTKGHPPELLLQVAEAGLGRIGENRVQEAEEKRRWLGGKAGLRWHLIGHLQRNKAARAVRIFDAVESVDSVRLARRLARVAAGAGRAPLEVLVEVNTSGEATKSGFPVDEALDGVREVCRLPELRVEGLMTIAPYTSEERVLRGAFGRLRELFERCGRDVPGFQPRTLSMGMSNDYEIAVEEGSTRLRLGTVLFGERPEA